MGEEGTVTLPLYEYLALHDAYNSLMKLKESLIEIAENYNKEPIVKSCISKDIIQEAWDKVKAKYPEYELVIQRTESNDIYNAIARKDAPKEQLPVLNFKGEI